jgi:hypothetical protein
VLQNPQPPRIGPGWFFVLTGPFNMPPEVVYSPRERFVKNGEVVSLTLDAFG